MSFCGGEKLWNLKFFKGDGKRSQRDRFLRKKLWFEVRIWTLRPERFESCLLKVATRKLWPESQTLRFEASQSTMKAHIWYQQIAISTDSEVPNFRCFSNNNKKNHFARWWQFYFIMMFSDDLSIGHEPFKVALPFVLLWSCLLQEINRTLTRRQYATLVVVVWQSYHRPTIGGLP